MHRSPEKLPDPWLFDSEKLLHELDRCRELVLQIPIGDTHATHFGINIAVDAIWNLTQQLRYLLHLHREGQRAFAQKSLAATGSLRRPYSDPRRGKLPPGQSRQAKRSRGT